MSYQQPELPAELAIGLDPVQLILAKFLILYTCIADVQHVPDPKDDTFESCPICLEDLAGEPTLRHGYDSHLPGWGQSVMPACGRTYHFICLLEWTKSLLLQNQHLTCPFDRQLLLPAGVSTDMFHRLGIHARPRHDIRNIDNVVRFWGCADPLVENPPDCAFELLTMHPEEALRLASIGFDVGFVSNDVVQRLPLSDEDRETFTNFDAEITLLPGRDGRGRRITTSTWKTYIYVGQIFEDVDDEEYNIILLIPVTEEVGKIFRRYLLGLMGEAYSIEINPHGRLNAYRTFLNDDEVVNLHAETEIRKSILQTRLRTNPPPTVTWYWPHQNNGGGIVAGGTLPDGRYPARGYELDGIDVGHANDHRFAILAANPAINAQARSDAQMADYINGILPWGYPEYFDLPGSNFAVAPKPLQATPDIPVPQFLWPPHLHALVNGRDPYAFHPHPPGFDCSRDCRRRAPSEPTHVELPSTDQSEDEWPDI